MWLITLGLLLAAVAGPASAARISSTRGQIEAQGPPTWPDTYEMEYTLSLPYVQTMQPGGLKYPVHVWWDGPGQKYRFDVYGGMDSAGWNLQDEGGYNWNVYPRITEVACDFTNGTSGPTARQRLMGRLGLGEGESSTPLPDISKWSYAGTAQVRNSEALVWQFSVRNGEKTANYQFYTARNGWPLRFYMMGRNIITGSHFDEYVVDFTRFKPGPISASAFSLPEPCKEGAAQRRLGKQQQLEAAAAEEGVAAPDSVKMKMKVDGGVAARVGLLLPAARLGSGPVSAVLDELRSRAETALEANARFVDEHNLRLRATAAGAKPAASTSGEAAADGPSYSLALNHFAHMNHEQWAATSLGLLPKRRSETTTTTTTTGGGGSGRPQVGGAARGLYQRVLADEQLPTFVDWRGTGADGPGVKDQVSCGSCWAFSAAGAMQGAWFKATGQSLSFSEQQLVDCAWDYGNNGCAGGFVEPTLQYVVDAGGITQESDYPYAAQNTFCKGPLAPPQPPSDAAAAAAAFRSDASAAPPLSARFSGYVNVPPRDEAALMEALALHGPVAVLMNAALPPFRFYSEGVYYNEDCSEDPDSMDHAILLVGYGTTQEGVDYWLIKNSWSKYWGMDGYARIARKGNDCGITTDPVLALVDAGAAAAAVAEVEAVAARAAAATTAVA